MSVMNTERPLLLVEDDEVDVLTVKRALRDLEITNELVIAGDGEAALDQLRTASSRLARSQYAADERPRIPARRAR